MKKKITNKNKNKKNQKILLKKILKITGYFFGGIFIIAMLVFVYFNLPVKSSNEKAQIGVTFSLRYAEDINLDWRETYLAILDDLKIRHIRIPVYWDLVEKSDGIYDFDDIDWQLQEAQKRDAKIILVIGQKVPRWPECFIPQWIGENDKLRKEKLLKFEEAVVERYKNNHPEIIRWQVENEPFLKFGVCPPADENLVDSEIAKVKSLDPTRPIVVTDSGELSLWIKAAKKADVFGTTMYREVYNAKLGHWKYPIGPNFFKAKQLLIKIFAGKEDGETIVIELQGEPWVEGWTVHAPIERQLESMNSEKLKENVQFAKNTGINEIYIWGVEWWYWMKTAKNDPSLWDTARVIVNNK